jgi:hypothetical protein
MVLLLHLNTYGQIDQSKLDSLSRSIDSSSKAYKAWQDSFNKAQDSIYRSSVKQDAKQNINNLNYFLEEQKRTEQERRRQATIRLIVSGLIFTTLIIFLIRKRKRRS